MQVNHENQPRVKIRKVWYPGSESILKGIALCYNHAYVTTNPGETATDDWARRDKTVAPASESLAGNFAGVALESYPGRTGGQWIFIAEPGSTCYALAGASVSTTVGVTWLVFSYTYGVLVAPSETREKGRGAALALQTTTGDARTCTWCWSLEDGPDSGLKA
ncbi:hypothetical protein HS125_04540 [bacterium]|nr:hypothetical protein [bacterium]